jgi:hypothetical protein
MSLPNVWRRVQVFLSSGGKAPSMKRFLCGLVVLGLFFAVAGQARTDFIYWTDFNGGDIQRANLDGSGQTTILRGLSSPVGITLDLAGGQMYWGDIGIGSIGRASLDGTGQTILVSGLTGPGGPALDFAGGRMYWNDGGGGDIRRAYLDGTGQEILVSGQNRPNRVTLDLTSGKIYWAENGSGSIKRANLDGTELTTLVTGLFGGNNVVALDVVGGKMYWTDNDNGGGDIRRANLDGTGEEILVMGLPGPNHIALDVADGLMYWTDAAGNVAGAGDIRLANLDGTGQQIIVTGLNGPAGTALDLGAPGTAVFYAIAAPVSVSAGTPFDITVTALDPYGNAAVNYQSTVTFSTSDPDAGIVLPADYSFTADDSGVHTFSGGVTLSTPGDQTITVTDTASGMTRTATVTVVPPG